MHLSHNPKPTNCISYARQSLFLHINSTPNRNRKLCHWNAHSWDGVTFLMCRVLHCFELFALCIRPRHISWFVPTNKIAKLYFLLQYFNNLENIILKIYTPLFWLHTESTIKAFLCKLVLEHHNQQHGLNLWAGWLTKQNINHLPTLTTVKIPSFVTGSVSILNISFLSPWIVYLAFQAFEPRTSLSVTCSRRTSTPVSLSLTFPGP